jgi:T3SS negative regulator,GrlR
MSAQGAVMESIRWAVSISDKQDTIMIRNGLYLVTSKLLDDVEGGATGISVFRDGTMRGGGPNYYHVGSYVCAGGEWKGELTVREHTPTDATQAWFARQTVSMGFNGTYTDDDAEFDATALVGKRSIQMKVIFRLLTPA